MAMAMATNGGWFGRRSNFLFPEEIERERLREQELMEWSAWAHHGHRLWASMSDAFWVYIFKVRRCPQSGPHDWTVCPYSHRGERAHRRDPRRYAYMGVACPAFRASRARGGTGEAPACALGRDCRFAHGVFELWLHPQRFRTRMCDAGMRCPRRICFFAHYAGQLRREDDYVPYEGLEVLPDPPPPLPSLPPPRLRPRPRFVQPAPAATSLPRPGMMLQTRAGDKLPLHGFHGGDEGASSSSSSASSSWNTVVTAPPVDFSYGNPTSSAGTGSSSSSRRVVQDPDSDDDDVLPDFNTIMDMLESLMMD